MSEWTEIVCILDRSGSMQGFEEDTVGGFNAFVERQREEEGRARLTLVLFDDEYEIPWEHVDVDNVPELDERLYFPRGSTALHDAVGRTINNVRGTIAADHEDERPENVIVLVVTDGLENASEEYTKGQVKNLVAETREEGWEYVFLGADIDAFGAARDLSMGDGRSSRVAKTGEGMRELYSKMNRSVTQLRQTGSLGDVDSDLDEDGWI